MTGWAKSGRCSMCSINFPPQHSECAVCGEKLSHFSNIEFDADWREQVERARLELQADTAIRWELGPTALAMFKGQIATMRGADDFILECEAVCKEPPIGWDGDETGHRIEADDGA